LLSHREQLWRLHFEPRRQLVLEGFVLEGYQTSLFIHIWADVYTLYF